MQRDSTVSRSVFFFVTAALLTLISCASTPEDPGEIGEAIGPDFTVHSANESELLIVYRGQTRNPREVIEAAFREVSRVETNNRNLGIFLPQTSDTYLLATFPGDIVREYLEDRIDNSNLLQHMSTSIVEATVIRG